MSNNACLCSFRQTNHFLSCHLQTNFNTVLTREKLKKEQIISELSEKLRKVTQQQEKDKGECHQSSGYCSSLDPVPTRYNRFQTITTCSPVTIGPPRSTLLPTRSNTFQFVPTGPNLFQRFPKWLQLFKPVPGSRFLDPVPSGTNWSQLVSSGPNQWRHVLSFQPV